MNFRISVALSALIVLGATAFPALQSRAQQEEYQHHHHHGQGGNGYGGNGYGGNGYGSNGGGGVGSLARQDNRVTNQEQWVQNRLNQGNLTPQQQANLQNRMTQLQGEQSQINGQLGTDLSARQGQLQNMLNSGTLNPTQQANVQNRLNQIQSEQNALNAGTNPFAGQAGAGYGGGWNRGGWNGGGNAGWGGNPAGSNGSFGGLVKQDNRDSKQEQWIQNQLNSGNLSPQQQQALQSRLSQLQSQQSSINGQLGTDLTNRQTYLQNMLNSGNLNPQQQANIQSELQQIQSRQAGLNAGTNPFFQGAP